MPETRGRIVSIRKGSVQWNDDDRCQLASLLVRAGYSVRIGREPIENGTGKNVKQEYFVEYWKEEE